MCEDSALASESTFILKKKKGKLVVYHLWDSENAPVTVSCKRKNAIKTVPVLTDCNVIK